MLPSSNFTTEDWELGPEVTWYCPKALKRLTRKLRPPMSDPNPELPMDLARSSSGLCPPVWRIPTPTPKYGVIGPLMGNATSVAEYLRRYLKEIGTTSELIRVPAVSYA